MCAGAKGRRWDFHAATTLGDSARPGFETVLARPRSLPAPGAAPLARFAFWVSAQECTFGIDRAREQPGYAPVRTIGDGPAEMRAGGDARRLSG